MWRWTAIQISGINNNGAFDLAILGGTPAFSEKLHVGRPNIGDRMRFQDRVNDILDRRWLTNDGPYVQEFERHIADLVGVEHCVAMCNATVALEIAIRALGMTGQVILPSFTFIATAHALQWQQIKPVFCDILPRTHALDPDKVEQMITSQVTGIIGVNVWGRPCDINGLTEIARRHELKLLFDSAQAFGCSYKGRMIGSFGDAEVFSFHATKVVNSLEGGAVVTNDGQLAQKIRLMKNFGFTDHDRTNCVGTNGKMHEVSAAMGLTNLESIDDFISVNRRNHAKYAEELAGLDGVSLLTYEEEEKSNYHYVVLEIDPLKIPITCDHLVEILHAENVLARRYFWPGCHRMEPYCSQYPGAGKRLPETEKVTERILCLPTGTSIDQTEVTAVCQLIRRVLNNGADSHKLNT